MAISRDHRLLALGLIPCMLVSVAALVVVPWFNSIFAAVGLRGAFLPWPTRVLSATYPWWGVTALVTVELWLFWPTATRRGSVAASFGVWFSAALFVFGVVGCYAPIFALASNR